MGFETEPAKHVSILRQLNQGLINQICYLSFLEPRWFLFQVHTWKFPPFLVLEIQQPCRPSWKSKIYLYAKLAAGSAPGDVGEGDWKSSMKSGRNHRALLALGWTWSCWGDPQSQVSPFLEVANWRNIVSLLYFLRALITSNFVLQQLFEVYSLQDVSPIPKRPLRHSSTRISFLDALASLGSMLESQSVIHVFEILSNPEVSKSRYFGISIPIKYSNLSRFYKKNGSIL